LIGVRVPGGQVRGLIVAALVSLIGAGFSAHAGLAVVTTPAPLSAAPPAVGYEADEHFPGAALLYADEPARAVASAPATGVTGTIDLPDIAVPQVALADASVRPAAPFVLRGAAVDKARALQCLTSAIYYEAASEPDAGQAAVAQVILNRVRHPAFPASVCGVVYQGSEKRGCQFSFACDGSLARVPMRSAWERARRAAANALAGGVFAGVGLATHYHTYAVTPSWNRSLVMTGVYGAHFFHRWKGWWGTPAAFRQAYSGVEPIPGPHPRVDLPTPLVTPPIVLAAAQAATVKQLLDASAIPTAAVAPAAAASLAIMPEHAESGTPLPQFAGGTTAESTVLDRWKDSGKPLR